MIIRQQHETLAADWQQQLREVVDTHSELLALLDLNAAQLPSCELADREFAVKVPRSFVARMRPGDPDDPLLLQVLTSGKELLAPVGYSEDPVGETGTAIRHSGMIQKYRGRVLLLLSGGCAINCRYCFRRHFPYEDNRNSLSQWHRTIDKIAGDESISEVILSGGDPLLVDDKRLAQLCSRIAAITHIKRLRVHSRLPVVIPQRITEGLLEALTPAGVQTVLVIHSNHANEIDAELAQAMTRCRERDITVLNQAVLLRGVNDSAQALVELSETLFAAGVMPYYLHLLDKVRGAAHFDVPEDQARTLMAEVAAQLPGYLLPRLVKEEAGATAKTAILPAVSQGQPV